VYPWSQYPGLTPGVVGLYQFNVVVPNIPANDKTPLTFSLSGIPGAQTLSYPCTAIATGNKAFSDLELPADLFSIGLRFYPA
jgi:hypothetical protein